ncbi:MAG: GntR family transcriptional regulator [Pseudomonadota bacterium]
MSQPLYQAVKQHLLDKINTGKLVPGDLIPSEAQLSRALGVSIGTVRKAIDILEQERKLYRHQGKGTYVSHVNFDNSLFRFFTYGDETGESARFHKETPERRRVDGEKWICKILQVPANTPLIYIERVGFDHQELPVLVEQCWWLAELVPGIENAEVHIPDLLYAVIEERFGVHVIRAEETLTADSATEYLSHKLLIEPGAPLVVLHRRTYSNNDRLIEYRITHGRADRFSYKTEIR